MDKNEIDLIMTNILNLKDEKLNLDAKLKAQEKRDRRRARNLKNKANGGFREKD